MELIKPRLTITDWAEADRPREKMMLKGVTALSDAELLAILIGSGNKTETAVELSQRILHTVQNDLNLLGKLEVEELIKNFNGIGEAKAITIVAALELGKRRKNIEVKKNDRIITSYDVYSIFHSLLGDLKHEEAWILLLNQSNVIIKQSQIGKGGITSTIVDVRLVIKEALEKSATNIILIHNHPSGDPTPSIGDNTLTKKLKEACHLLDIKLLDHLIICDNGYYSYKDKELII